jgi:hypothetical protein
MRDGSRLSARLLCALSRPVIYVEKIRDKKN